MEIEFEGLFKAKKGNEVRVSRRKVVPIHPIAAGTWDAVLIGIEPKLMKAYKVSVASYVREEL